MNLNVALKLICCLLFLTLTPSCASIASVSYTNASVDQRPNMTESASIYRYLQLTDVPIEDGIIELNRRMSKRCNGDLVNVQLVVTAREFILVQRYEIRMTAQCKGR